MSVQNEAVGLSSSFSTAEQDVYELVRPVFFIGFMGAGKTSVARKLARMCGVASVDMDTYLERREGKKIKDIFAEVGEEGFRAIETDVLVELMGKDPLLVSCGGGVITRAENREMLAEGGFVVFLYVDADEAAGAEPGGDLVRVASHAERSVQIDSVGPDIQIVDAFPKQHAFMYSHQPVFPPLTRWFSGVIFRISNT